MSKKAWGLGLTAALLTSTVGAGTMGSLRTYSDWTWVATLSGGPVWGEAGRAQTFFLTPDIEKHYTVSDNSSTLGEGQFFLGIQDVLSHSQDLVGQLGVEVATAGSMSVSGQIWDDAYPQFNNHSYTYNIKHTHLALKGKLLLDKKMFLTPWVSAAVGISFNRNYGFNNTALIEEALPNPNFSSEVTNAFMYSVGLGVQRELTQNWQVGVGYEFADWGKSSLGRASGQTLNQGLSVNHIYTNGLLFNVTYVV